MYHLRPSHRLRPLDKRIIIADGLKEIGNNKNKFIITIVPYLYDQPHEGESKVVVKFEKIGIIIYDRIERDRAVRL
jgi:hypothetical protein